jgi:hypothetical protein
MSPMDVFERLQKKIDDPEPQKEEIKIGPCFTLAVIFIVLVLIALAVWAARIAL